MATKTEELDKELLNTLREEQQNINTISLTLGQIHIRVRELNKELERYDNIVKELEEKYDSSNQKINEILNSLNEKYEQGDIDLENGTITFEEK